MKFNFQRPVGPMIVHPQPQQLTLMEWLGIKPKPVPAAPSRLYLAVGNSLYISDEKGDFNFDEQGADVWS